MIFHGRIGVTVRTVTGQDPYGNDEYSNVTTEYPGEVRPLSSAETVAGRDQVVSRYRVFLSRFAADAVTPSGAVSWLGDSYEIDGDVERHTVGGRLHHLEAVVKRTTG